MEATAYEFEISSCAFSSFFSDEYTPGFIVAVGELLVMSRRCHPFPSNPEKYEIKCDFLSVIPPPLVPEMKLCPRILFVLPLSLRILIKLPNQFLFHYTFMLSSVNAFL